MGGEITPADWPILVTGASGFVGGHVARDLARSGFPVRGLTRRPPDIRPGDPAIDWHVGDLRDPAHRRRALRGARGVVHAASWVSLGVDPRGHATEINVRATRDLLCDAASEGVERLVYTSTLHTLAAGTADAPADESTPWNLDRVRSPYSESKREAERIVLDGPVPAIALCPGMVVGDRDPKPTSTRVLILMARGRTAILPRGGIPILDASVAALAHRRALSLGDPGTRYAVVGPYLSYLDLATLVARLTGNPRRIITLPDPLGPPLAALAGLLDRLSRGRFPDVSSAAVAGGFLRLHVTGARADAAFGLSHPAAMDSIRSACKTSAAPA
ncbi:NAD-dependent epimerase/dehydratase family protein [Tundrisphaera sp. TA3]|uniref:NAD-dependent epimerase/dehydratase family protein n=1 Tax=Tundrisphaera sp. TA3 TaxID=3435775 RepID=UPI003EB8EECC